MLQTGRSLAWASALLTTVFLSVAQASDYQVLHSLDGSARMMLKVR